MAALIAERAWDQTPLGAAEAWPQSLKTIVDLVTNSPLAMLALWGPSLVQIYNAPYAKIAGDRHPQALGQSTRDCWPEVWNLNAPVYDAVLRGEVRSFTQQPLNTQRLGKEETAWFDLAYSPLRDETKAVAGILVMVIDVTRQVRAMAETEESQKAALRANFHLSAEGNFRRSLFVQAPGFIATLRGPDHCFDLVSDSFKRLVQTDDLAGKRFVEVLPDGFAPGFAGELDAMRRSKSVLNARHVSIATRMLPAGAREARIYDFVFQPILEPGHSVIGVFVEATDVTDALHARAAWETQNRSLEQQLQQRARAQSIAEETLHQAQKMDAVGQLTGGLAHDFNNFLAGIVGSLSLMRKRIAQGRFDELDRYLAIAQTSADRAAALTNRLLNFSRNQPIAPNPTDIGKLAAAMRDLIGHALGGLMTVDIAIEADLWLTLCDPNQLENALLNLAINARDAMPGGGALTIGTRNLVVEAAQPGAGANIAAGDYVCLDVVDDGAGMPPEVAARAFEPFFTTKGVGKGTGLGLSMVHGFATQSGGHISIESKIGEGTRVRILLPRYLGEMVPEPAAMPAKEPRQGSDGRTVLVVDDEPVVRMLVMDVLKELNLFGLDAADGPTGLRLLTQEPRVDLLVTDIGLPGMNGRQLAKAARLVRPALKILFITGYAESALDQDELLDGDVQVIAKPFGIEVLAAKIDEMTRAD